MSGEIILGLRIKFSKKRTDNKNKSVILDKIFNSQIGDTVISPNGSVW